MYAKMIQIQEITDLYNEKKQLRQEAASQDQGQPESGVTSDRNQTRNKYNLGKHLLKIKQPSSPLLRSLIERAHKTEMICKEKELLNLRNDCFMKVYHLLLIQQ
jgi:hypothetical protein